MCGFKVDLAGSERIKESGAEGVRLKESLVRDWVRGCPPYLGLRPS
jgi:hypothetical protein